MMHRIDMTTDIPNHPGTAVVTYEKTRLGEVVAEYSNSGGLSLRREGKPGAISLTMEETNGLRDFLKSRGK